jgi:drug/metabolite transporter (DMT)-like permease
VKKGIVCILISAFGFALMGALVRLSDSFGEPLPTVQKALFRNLVAFVAAGLAFARAGGRRNPELRLPSGKREKCDLLLRCVFGTCGVFANFYAVGHIPLGDAMALNKTAPVFAMLASWVLLDERISAKQAICFAGAFVGAMLVVKPGATVFSGASLVGLFGGFCAGTAYAYLHKLGRSGVGGSYIVLVFSAFSSLACVPFVLHSPCAMTPAQTAMLCGAGLAAAVGQFGITWAYRFAEPRQVAAYDYAGVLFAAMFGFALFGQVPDMFSCAGFALVAVSGIVLRRR